MEMYHHLHLIPVIPMLPTMAQDFQLRVQVAMSPAQGIKAHRLSPYWIVRRPLRANNDISLSVCVI